MDLAGTAVGIASLGIQVCQALLNYYDTWKQYDDDIAVTFGNIERLNSTFLELKTVLSKVSQSTSKQALTALEACQESLAKLQKKATKLQTYPQPTGLRQNIITQLQRIWYPLRKSTLIRLQEIAADIQDQLMLSLDLVKLDIDLNLGAELTEITGQITKVHINTEKISLQNEQTLALLQSDLFERAVHWLNAADAESYYHLALTMREQGTGSWLVDSPVYSQWISGSIRHLWLYGKAGCGKSIISAAITENIRSYCRDHNGMKCAMFYFVFDDINKQSFKDCLTSIVAQISYEEPGLSMLLQAYQNFKANPPKEDELEKILLAVIGSQEKFIMVLDGLDESPEYSASGQALRRNLLLSLSQLSYKAPKLKILATSRHLIEIEDQMSQLGALPQSMLVEFVNRDIKTYVANQLAVDPRLCTLSHHMKDRIENCIAAKADGMFRWAYCQMQDLKSLQSTRASHVEAAMETLPATLDETYYRMLKRIQPQLYDDAVILLRWMAYSKRPLTLGELNETVLVDLKTPEGNVAIHDRGNVRDVLEILSGLVVIVPDQILHIEQQENEVTPFDYENSRPKPMKYPEKPIIKDPIMKTRIKLAHFSVKEYLASSRILETNAHAFHLYRPREEKIIMDSCLVYLMHYAENRLVTRTENDLTTFPLLRYAASYWPEHYQDDINLQKSVVFFQSQKNINCWTSIYQPDRNWREPFDKELKLLKPGTGLYYASYMGLNVVVKTLVKLGMNANIEGGYYGTALSAAAAGGHETVADILIQHNADINMHGGGHMATALQVAAFYGRVKIASILIGHGANVNAPGDGFFGTPIHAAACSGNEPIIDLLISNGADINMATDDHGNALIAAAAHGHDQIVKKLVNSEGKMSVQTRGYRTALMAAAGEGREHVVTMLIEQYGTDVNEQSGQIGTALVAASLTNNIQIVDLLIQKYNAQVDMQSGIYGTALIAAARLGHEKLARRLIEKHHANINLHACGLYKNALLAAAVPGHKRIIKLLIEHSADLSATDDEGRTIVHCVTRCGYLDIFNQPYNTGNIDLNLTDKHGKSILDYACISGNLQLVSRVLHLIQKSSSNCRSKFIWSPVHWACRSGSFELVTLLQIEGERARPVSTNQPSASWTPLDIAIYHNNWDLLSVNDDSLRQYGQTITTDEIVEPSWRFSLNELSAFRANAFKPANKVPDRYCDGCLSAIYGVHYRCQTCYDTDYCFMCKTMSDTVHPNHGWDNILSPDGHT